MRIQANHAKYKRSLALEPRAGGQLQALREYSQAGSDSDVIRTALAYLAQFAEDRRAGYRLVIRSRGEPDRDAPIVQASREAEFEAAAGATVKRTLVLHERTARVLDDLKGLTGLPTESELIRQALALYHLLAESVLAGKQLVLVRPRPGKQSPEEMELRLPVFRPRAGARAKFSAVSGVEHA
jgi:Arc/MetJ-type ribon-helix-helix transcriptional regulator